MGKTEHIQHIQELRLDQLQFIIDNGYNCHGEFCD